ncbi:MAG TPA: hypothetical protein VFN31_01680, partial [Candidatus Saccharimonadales bacterium]|nr:hypothetical protein [Candidatus Saccharimonadales bacterium]
MTKIRANSNTGTLSICFVLATVFILEQLLLPVNPSSAGFYQTSVANYRLLSILINLPILIIWFVAFWGYSRLRVYAKLLGKAPEARGYRLLSTGLAWLAWTLPLTAIVDRLLSSFDIHNSSQSIFTIISNYFNLLMPFVAFIIIFIAAKVLFRSQKPKAREAKYPVFITVFLLLGALYCYLILKTADLSSLSSTNN